MGGLSSDQSDLYLSHGLVSRFRHKLHNDQREKCLRQYIYIIVYSPFSDRVGLPLHNIHNPSPFTSIMGIFFVDLKFGHIHFYTIYLLSGQKKMIKNITVPGWFRCLLI